MRVMILATGFKVFESGPYGYNGSVSWQAAHPNLDDYRYGPELAAAAA